METVLGANGEVSNPGKTLPRALGAAMLACALLYIAIQVAAQGLLGADLATAKAPLAEGVARIDPRLGPVLLVGMAISLFAWMGSDLLGAPRLLFAFGRDGYLPSALGRLSGKGQTPMVAIAVHAVVAILLAITGTFEQLAVLAALAGCVLYIGACLAAWKLKRQGTALLGQPLNLPGLTACVVIGALSMAAAIFLAQPVEIAATLATVLASMGLYALARLRKRKAAA